MPYVHEFSDGYYIVDGLYVEPSEYSSSVRIQDHIYEYLQEEYYGEQNAPVLFRHNGTKCHFRIEPADDVRSDTIEMPFEIVDKMSVETVPIEEQFLMAKPGHAQTIVDLANPDIGGGVGD